MQSERLFAAGEAEAKPQRHKVKNSLAGGRLPLPAPGSRGVLLNCIH